MEDDTLGLCLDDPREGGLPSDDLCEVGVHGAEHPYCVAMGGPEIVGVEHGTKMCRTVPHPP